MRPVYKSLLKNIPVAVTVYRKEALSSSIRVCTTTCGRTTRPTWTWWKTTRAGPGKTTP